MDVTKTKAGKRYLYLFLIIIAQFTAIPGYTLGKQNTLNFKDALPTRHLVISVGGGGAITSDFGKSQNFPIVDASTDEFYNYTVINNNQTRALYDVFVGGEWALRAPWLVQLGLDFNQIQILTTSGSLLQGIDSTSADQYSYRYALLTRQLLAEGKLLYHKNRFYPYVMLGLGAAFNKAYNYSTTVPPFITFTRQYNNYTQASFSYNAGIGVDVEMTANWRAGIGYRFTDLGTVSLGPASINTTSVSGTLTQDHLYINEIIAQFTWII